MRLKWLFLISLVGAFLALTLQSLALTVPPPAPVLFFSDLVQGPNSGNSDATYAATGGAYVTLYGNFLDNFNAVQLNGSSCLTVVSNPAAWMWYERMVVKIGTSCASGNFTVTTAAGTSNGIAFTVVTGNIWYVSASGNDSNAGTFSAPFATTNKAKHTLADGDIAYIVGPFTWGGDDGEPGGLSSSYSFPNTTPNYCASNVNNPRALVGYPGTSVTIGSTASHLSGVRTDNNCKGGYTFAEISFRGQDNALQFGYESAAVPYTQNWRAVGNDVSCPNGNAQTGCIDTNKLIGLWILGNNIHDVGSNNTPGTVTELYHAIYVGCTFVGGVACQSTTEIGSQDVEVAWNTVQNWQGNYGIQEYTNGGGMSTNVSIHDNTIHDGQASGISTYGENPNAIGGGPVTIYNNLIYRTGKGPEHTDGAGNYTCITDSYNSGTESGTMEIFNNTCYDNGNTSGGFSSSLFGASNNAGSNSTLLMRLRNNIIYQLNSAAPYCHNDGSQPNGINGSNDVMFGIGAPPSPNICTGSSQGANKITSIINSDPGFVSVSSDNYHLSSATSPANGAGVAITGIIPFGNNWISHDHDGLLRPSPPSIGSSEYAAGTAAAKPDPPTNLTVVVN